MSPASVGRPVANPRRWAKQQLARAAGRMGLFNAGLRLRWTLSHYTQVVILTYHRVAPAADWPQIHSSPHILVTPETLDLQLGFLARFYEVVPLAELVARCALGQPFPVRTAVLTFDDGWRDNVVHAAPLLKKHGLPATVFLATGYVGTQRVFWPERMSHLAARFATAAAQDPDLGRRLAQRWPVAVPSARLLAVLRTGRFEYQSAWHDVPEPEWEAAVAALEQELPAGAPFPQDLHAMMSWDEVRAWCRIGIDFGSHTAEHHDLTALPPEALAAELAGSRAVIREQLDERCDLLAYPYGRFNAQVMAELPRHHYRAAVTQVPGLNSRATDPYALRRINVSESRFLDEKGRFSVDLFAATLAGWFPGR